ncbi:hypothetical protein ES288_A08G211400v1 [Gossypium darwinii]|uniref:Uncharacterized protein n=1 Tax=Gossypium darwinii TaxID=34276 RepID=A0A5D2FNV8_GOSDA|nr:hypothetical protein ES288_A08G211400v1 [Gossypium darwinii]
MVGIPLMIDVCTSSSNKSKSPLLSSSFPDRKRSRSILIETEAPPRSLSFHDGVEDRLGSTTISSAASSSPSLNLTFLVNRSSTECKSPSSSLAECDKEGERSFDIFCFLWFLSSLHLLSIFKNVTLNLGSF